MKKISLTLIQKTFLSVIAVFLPLIIAFFYNLNINKEVLMGHALEDLSSQAFVYEEVLSQFLEKSKNRVQDFSSDGVIRSEAELILNGNRSAVKSLSDYISKNKLIIDKSIYTISIISPEGKVIASTDLSAVGGDLSGEEYFKKGKDRVSVAERKTSAPELPEIVASAPLLSISTGMPIGVIANYIRMSELNSILESIETEEYEREVRVVEAELKRHRIKVYLVNEEKRLISKPSSVKDIELNHIIDTLPVKKALESNEELSGFYENYKKISVAGASEYLPEMRWILIMEEDVDDILAHARMIGRNMLITASIVLGIIIILFIAFFKDVVMRIKRVSFAAEDIAKGNYETTIPIEAMDEIGILSRSFNRMSSEIKRETGELEESRKKYEDLINSLNVGIFKVDTEGNLIEVNRACFEMADADSREELLRYNVIDLLVDKGKLKEIVDRLLKGESVVDEQIEFITIKGDRIWTSVSAIIKKEGEDKIYLEGMIEEITEKKRLEDQLRHAQKMEAVGILAGGIAHDFNNILSAIMNYGNLLIMKKGGDEMTKKFAEQIVSASERGAGLTRGILAFSRKQVVNLQVLDLNELIGRTKKILMRLIGEDVELITNLIDKPLNVNADEVQIDQVLMNLATNARDAMPNGGKITIGTSIADINGEFIRIYGYGSPGSYAVISFADTGIGMDEETKKKIFEPFFTTKGVGKGTGLGLSISYGIIKQHNGYINVFSEKGKGTEFSIYLPITCEIAKEKTTEEAAVNLRGKETLLLAEDNSVVREAARAILEEYSYKVIEAVDGEDAVKKFNENKDNISLIISDMIMPKKSGKEAYEEIKKTTPDVKIIFLSGYTEDQLKTRDITEEGINLLFKPITPNKLLRKVREVIDKKS
jgi:PAS domain S-box-containing protein